MTERDAQAAEENEQTPDDEEPSIVIYDCALKHGFTEDEIREAWESAVKTQSFVRVGFDKQPPHYMAVGFVGDRKVELIAFSEGLVWKVFHARLAFTGGFKNEYREGGGLI